MVVDVGETTATELMIVPGDQVYVWAPVAVKVVFRPEQMLGELAEIEIFGVVFTTS
jgi:hypothetical protein